MYEIYAALRDERGLKDLEVSRATGISASTLSDWKHGRIVKLKAEKLKALADFFDVSMDYLVSGEEKQAEHLSAMERRLLAYVRALSPGSQKIIEDTARALSETNRSEGSAS